MIKGIYSILRFLFEILSIVSIGYWGFSRVSLGNWRYLLGIAAPLIVIAVWSIWGAPSSSNRLQGIARLLLELSVYTVSAVCIYNTDAKQLTLPFILIALVNALINYFSGWLI